jgi:hypothetical protein
MKASQEGLNSMELVNYLASYNVYINYININYNVIRKIMNPLQKFSVEIAVWCRAE